LAGSHPVQDGVSGLTVPADASLAQGSGEELVSVVIPAYNAAATLPDTLASVLAQTYRWIEVVVVDDGSVDATSAIVVATAARDARVRLVRQANTGVAAARNRGIAATGGRLIAFVDADDIWVREKIAKQVAALEAAGETAGLCYTWFDTIDANGMILQPVGRSQHQGAVLAALCENNFVGNGSSLLVRRTALERVSGFDASLHTSGAQGCEDYDLLLRVAEHYDFVLIQEALVGYRVVAGSMSINRPAMVFSHRLVAERVAQRRPDLAPLLIKGRINYTIYLMAGLLLRGRLTAAATLAALTGLPLRRLAPRLAWETALRAWQAAARAVRRWRTTARRFGDAMGADAA
jgi:glycosyltransferase involved in cell wall biosynthesis